MFQFQSGTIKRREEAEYVATRKEVSIPIWYD